MKTDWKESDLFPPLRDWLLAAGYEVKAEVNGCDVVAVKDDEITVIEMKKRLNLELLTQLSERLRITPSVYAAVPAPTGKYDRRRWGRLCRLLRRLEVGLITILPGSGTVQIVFHPLPYQSKREKNRRIALLREMAGRGQNWNKGGVTRKKLITAYREVAIRIACILQKEGPTTTRILRQMGTGHKTTAILYANHYGWFQRVGHGVYNITSRWLEEREKFGEVVKKWESPCTP